MQDKIIAWNERAAAEQGSRHRIEIDRIIIEPGALKQAAAYIADQRFARVLLVADSRTYEAAGSAVETALRGHGLEPGVCLIPPDHQGDVIADERSIVHLLLHISPEETDLLVAVGSGTLHDITRFAAYKMNKPFLSIPTAPSVDGFNSKGAPILIQGRKITIAASAPIAIFADLDVLVKAPRAMVAAGFGDMLGKYTSLFDWKFSSAVAGEPYSPLVAEITEQALLACTAQVQRIAAGDAEGIRSLMAALIESGLAMLIFGQSHPASGAEHHLSHYWEMEFLKEGRKQLLHGAKVGVACVEIAALYRRIAAEGPDGFDDAVRSRWGQIVSWLEQLPQPEQLQQWLQTAGGPNHLQQLGIEPELAQRSLQQAHHVRARYTLLRAYNERGQSAVEANSR